jgi:hypothetical protein
MGRSISARCSNCFTTLITDLSGGPGIPYHHSRFYPQFHIGSAVIRRTTAES